MKIANHKADAQHIRAYVDAIHKLTHKTYYLSLNGHDFVLLIYEVIKVLCNCP